MGQTGKKSAIRGLMGFEFLIKLACLSFCFPLFSQMLKFCIRVSGYSYVTKENAVRFFLQPMSLAFVVFLFVFCAMIILYEMCAVSLAVRQQKADRTVTPAGLVFGGFDYLQKLLKRKTGGIWIAFFSLLFVFFIDLPVFLFLLIGLRQTSEVVQFLIKPVWLVIMFLAVFFLWWVALFGCAIVLVPGIDHGKVDNIKRVRKRLLRSYQRLLKGLIKRSVILFLVEALVYIGGLMLMIFLVRRLTKAETTIIVLMHTFERFHLIFCILSASLNAVIYEYFCASLFYEKRTKEQVDQFSEEELAFTEHRTLPGMKWKRAAFGAAITITLISCGLSTFFFFRNGAVLIARAIDTVNITAHRGSSKAAPENTMAAIELAISETADYVELDVRLTADGVAVLSHDASLYRMTGASRYIRNMTFEELKGYDVGKRFSDEFAKERIPSLREVFEAYGGEVGFNLDLKPYGKDALAQTVVELIEEYRLEDSCVITSESYSTLEKVKELNSRIKTGQILSIAYGDFYENEAADFFSIRADFVTDGIVAKAHALGKEVHVWTVNSEKDLIRMKTVGADNIITDVPVYAREVIYNGELVDTIREWMNFLFPNK